MNNRYTYEWMNTCMNEWIIAGNNVRWLIINKADSNHIEMIRCIGMLYSISP